MPDIRDVSDGNSVAQAKFCLECGAKNLGTRFCEECGAEATTSSASTGGEEFPRPPSSSSSSLISPSPTAVQPGGIPLAYVSRLDVERTNGLAIAALILGLLSFTIIPIILGHVALSQITRSGERGRGMAIAGIVLGWVWILLLLILFAVIFGIVARY